MKGAKSWLEGSYGEDTKSICVQTDIKQVFTYLNTTHIKTAVEWFLKKILEDEKRRARNKVWFLQNKKEKKDIRLATGKGEGTDWAFSEHDIMNVVSLDIDNVYVTCRGAVWKQNQGCPIGGFLSAMYANIKCMYDEKTFIHSLGTQARRMYAIIDR